MRSIASRCVAAALVVAFTAGCATRHAPHHEAPPPSPPTTAPAAPEPSSADYQDGFRAGKVDGHYPSVAGYYVGGVIGGIAVIAVCALMLAAGSGGGSGCGGSGCGNGGGGSSSEKRYLPPNAHQHSDNYRAGYDAGYKERYEKRKERALGTGFGIGVVIFAVGALWYLSDPDRRKKVDSDNDANTATSNGLSVRF